MNILLSLVVHIIIVLPKTLWGDMWAGGGWLGSVDDGTCYRICPDILSPTCAFNGECYKLFNNRCDWKNVNNCKDINYHGPSIIIFTKIIFVFVNILF